MSRSASHHLEGLQHLRALGALICALGHALYWNFGPRLQGFVLDFFLVPHPNPDFGGLWRPHLIPGWTLNLQLGLSALYAFAVLAGRFHLVALSGLITGMVAVAALWPTAPGLLEFYGQPTGLAFLAGALLHRTYRRWPPRPCAPAHFLLLMMLAAAAFMWAGRALGTIALSIVSAAGVWLFLRVPPTRGRWAGLARTLGDASYPIYLFHAALVFPLLQWVLSLWPAGAGGITADVSPTATGALLILYVVASAWAGLLIHRALEVPLLVFIRRRWRPEAPASAGAPQRAQVGAGHRPAVTPP